MLGNWIGSSIKSLAWLLTSDPNLRCALPVTESLDAAIPLTELKGPATILAADGSQIAPDRHAALEYCLVNVGAIRMQLLSAGQPLPPLVQVESQLYYDDALYMGTGTITEARLALMRDLRERSMLRAFGKWSPIHRLLRLRTARWSFGVPSKPKSGASLRKPEGLPGCAFDTL